MSSKSHARGEPPSMPVSVAFLLAQVGARAAAQFAARLEVVGFAPQEAAILRQVAMSPGISQRELGERLAAFPSRLVAILDGLQERGLVERREAERDRRVHALHLTTDGLRALREVGTVARAHEAALCSALTAAQRDALAVSLRAIAEREGLLPGVHPKLQKP